jgi:nucleotide-binding universal stress UspA family protein
VSEGDVSEAAAVAFRHLSAPVDGTAEGERALPLALALAGRLGARITLVHVVPPPPLPIDDAGAVIGLAADTTPKATTAADEYLTDLARRTAARPVHVPPVSVETALLDGDPADAIAAHARRAGVDLVVMPTHAHGAVTRALLGSVALHVVRRSGVPSLLVPPAADHGGDEREPPVTGEPASLPHHVLLPTDGSEFAARIVDVVAPLAAALGARCTVLDVVEPMAAATSLLPADDTPADDTPADGAPGDGAPRDGLADAMARTVARLHAAGVDADAEVLARGRPATAVTAYAEAHHVDLVALATHAARGIGRLLGGSVADAVVHAARCPVLLWHPPGDDGRRPHA